jgi:hypothetical protein
VTLPPLQNEVGPLGVMVGTKAPTVTVALPLALQPLASVIVTLKATLPLPFGVKSRTFVPWPLVMTAFDAVQLNVAPALAGTEAVTFWFEQALDGAEIVATGGALTVTAVAAEVAVQVFG